MQIESLCGGCSSDGPNQGFHLVDCVPVVQLQRQQTVRTLRYFGYLKRNPINPDLKRRYFIYPNQFSYLLYICFKKRISAIPRLSLSVEMNRTLVDLLSESGAKSFIESTEHLKFYFKFHITISLFEKIFQRVKDTF